MATRYITIKQIEDFMHVLLPIQMRLIEKYGNKTISEWREERLNRGGIWQI